MKKILLGVLSCFIALGAGWANASSRSDAMSADLNVVEDYDLIFMFPNKVLDYKNTVDFRMGSMNKGTSDDWAGILDGKYEQIGVLGVYVNRATMITYPPSYVVSQNAVWKDNFSAIPFDKVSTPKPIFDLFWAKTLGDTDFGVQLSYADNKDNETGGYETPRFTPAYTEEVTDYARQYEFKVGVGMKGMGPFQEANFAVAYKLGKIGYSDQVSDPITGNYKIEDDGIHSFALNADLRHDMDENNNIKLFAGVRLNQVGMKGVSQVSPTQVFSSTVKTKYTNFVVGLGCNHKVAEGKGLVSAGLKLDVKAIKYEADVIDQNGEEYFAAQKAVTVDALMEDKNNTLVLPVFMSVEAKVKNWLTLRAGSEYHLYSKTHESGVYTFGPGDYYYTPESRFVLTTGFGLTWKNWALDGYLNTDMLERLAAKHDDGSPLASLDMRYKF